MVDSRGAVSLSERIIAERNLAVAEVETLTAEKINIAEHLDKVMAMLRREDKGWSEVNGNDDGEGLTLENLKAWEEKITPSSIAAPWVGKGYRARTNYIWQGGIKYDGIPKESRGKGTNVQDLIDDTQNQREFFGEGARRRREGCLYRAGIAIWAGDNNTKKLEAIPLSQIDDELRDPDRKSRIWAYRRSWTHTDPKTAKTSKKVEWIFTDTYTDKMVDTIKRGDEDERVNRGKTIFDQHGNGIEGFAYGSPDALAAWIWNAVARDAYYDGTRITAALASFAFKASVTTPGGSNNASMKLARPSTPGATAVLGATNDLTPLSSAGKGYDFSTLRALTAIIATSLDIPNIALTSDVSDAGSSYGSASTLDLPTRLAMEARRQEHIELDLRVLRWMGAKTPTARFDTLNSATDVFREAQALLLLWSSGMYEAAPLEERLSELLRIAGNSIPDGVLIPNNSHSWERADVDPSVDPNAPAPAKGGGAQTSAVGKPNATPAGQGQKSAVGKGKNANDLRSDGIGEMMQKLSEFSAWLDEQDAA